MSFSFVVWVQEVPARRRPTREGHEDLTHHGRECNTPLPDVGGSHVAACASPDALLDNV